MSAAINPADLPPDVNRGYVYYAVIVAFLVPSLLIVTLRTVVRLQFTKMWWDDYLIIVAMPFLLANNILSILSIQHGIGRHIFYLALPEVSKAAMYNVIAQPLNVWALFFVKASIVAFLLRLKPGKIYQAILWATAALLLAITVATFVITMAQCQPLAREWNPTIPGFCWSPTIFTNAAYILSGVTIFTDVTYIVIPIVFLWSVQLKKSIKYGVWGVLSLGSISMFCTIATIPFIGELSQTADVTYSIIDLAALKTAELNIAILVACIPPLQPLFKKAGELISRVPKTETETWESRQAKLKASSNYEMLSGSTGSKPQASQTSKSGLTANSSRMAHSDPYSANWSSSGTITGDDDFDATGIRKTTKVAVRYGA